MYHQNKEHDWTDQIFRCSLLVHAPLSDFGCSPIATERFERGISGSPSSENSGKARIGSPMRNVQSSSKARRSILSGQETRREVEEIVGMAIAMEEKSGKENQMKVMIPTGYEGRNSEFVHFIDLLLDDAIEQ